MICRTERAASPVESVLSVTSHPHPQPHASSSRLGATHSLSRAATTTGASKRTKPRHQDPLTYDEAAKDHSRNRDIYNAPPTSSSGHPVGYTNGSNSNGAHGYDAGRDTGDWASGHPPAGQLEGPGMPVSRGSSHPVTIAAAVVSSSHNGGTQVVAVAAEGGAADGGEPEGDGDDKTYCFCDGVSYGEMIACDEENCEREWVCFFAEYTNKLLILSHA